MFVNSRPSLTLLLLLFSLPLFTLADSNNLIIIEVQIAGEKTSYDSIKIYNPTDSDIYLGNFNQSYIRLVKRAKTSAKDYTIKSWFRETEAKIPAKGSYLWVSNKDGYDLVTGADTSTSQTISENNGIGLRLGSENSGEILDALGWGNFNNLLLEGLSFPENPKPNQKLKRKLIAGVYQDTNNNQEDFYLEPVNSLSTPFPTLLPTPTLILAATPTPTPTSTLKPSPTPSFLPSPEPRSSPAITNPSPLPTIQITPPPSSKIYPNKILFNEILASPLGPDETEEWIEITNQNNFEVEISGWQITDSVGKPTKYTFPEDAKIEAKGFLILKRPLTKIVLQNKGDTLTLWQPNLKIADTVSYENSPRNQSYNRTESGWSWSDTLTPGLKNIISLTSTKTQKQKQIPQADSPGLELEKKELKAAISQQSLKGKGFLLIFFIALFFATLAGITILILKKKIGAGPVV